MFFANGWAISKSGGAALVPDIATPLVAVATSVKVERRADWIGALAFAFSIVSLLAFAGAIWIYRTNPTGLDFTSFWAAGRLALGGHASFAYDYDAHRSVEMTAAHMGRAIPFPYPPPFLFVVMPFGLPHYWLAYLLWVTATGGVYIAATRRILPASYALGFPGALDNVVFGQNAFLTCSIFIIGTSLLGSQPFLGGAVLGLFVCKPQLACLFPIALLASRNWRAIGGATASSIALLGLAAVVFGLNSYVGFLAMCDRYAGMMSASIWPWNQVASVFGAARYFGISQGTALLVQAISALVAIALTWQAWARGFEQRVPILAASTLLVSPYLFTYDSLVLIVAIGWFMRERRVERTALVWLLSLLTLLCLFGLFPSPNLTPLAAAISLWWLHSDRVSRRWQRSSLLEPANA